MSNLTCPYCGREMEEHPCPRCDGLGRLYLSDDIEDDRTVRCHECNGTGGGDSGVSICRQCFVPDDGEDIE